MITWAMLALILLQPGGENQVASSDYFIAFDSLFKKYAAQYGLDWKMLKAIAMNEAGIGVKMPLGIEASVLAGLKDPNNVEGSKSYDGKSWGLMQVTLTTGRDFDSAVTPQKLNNPEYSIRLASQYLAWVTLRFQQSDPRYKEWVVKSYNQGVGNTLKEKNGQIAAGGYAQEYWDRYQRNFAKV